MFYNINSKKAIYYILSWLIRSSSTLIISVILLGFYGCSIIGTVIGANIDASKPDRSTIELQELETVKRGQKLDILLRNGEIVSGKFFRFDRMPQHEYTRNYSSAKEQNNALTSLPNLGSQITINQNNGQQVSCNLIGVDYNSLEVREKNQTDLTIVFLDSISSIVTLDGKTIDGIILRDLAVTGQIPFLSEIIIEEKTNNTSISRIALNKVSRIEIHNKKGGKFAGFAFGLIVDIIIIDRLLRNLMSDFKLDFGGLGY